MRRPVPEVKRPAPACAEPQAPAPGEDRWRLNEEVRARRLRERARRPLAQNLAEGLELSELLATFRGAARRG